MEQINKIENPEIKKRAIRAVEGAKREGVSDIQGYFNPNNRDPIRFIDIHFR